MADTEAVLARLQRVSSTVDGSAHGLRRAARAGSWRGTAAAEFRSDAGRLAGGLDDLVTALRSASRAVSAWQSRLVANQREADELEAAAGRLRPAADEDPAAAAELSRVLDRAGRLQARHLRQASVAAAAVRSGADVVTTSVGGVSAWPVEPAGWQAGQVSRWTGDLATVLQTMVPWMPGQEGGFGGSGRWPGIAGLPGGVVVIGGRPLPGDPADLGRPGLVGPAGLDGLPGRVGGPWVGPAVLPGPGVSVSPLEPAATAPAGWLDTRPAPTVRTPLDRLPPHRLPDLPTAHPAVHDTARPAGLAGRGEPTARPDRTVDRTVDRVADRPTARPNVRVGDSAPPVRNDADGRDAAPKNSGRGGEAHGSGRLGGHPALHAPTGPGGPAGLAHPPGQQVATGGGTAAATGAPPPLPAPPSPPNAPPVAPPDAVSGQTVEQQAVTPTPPGQPATIEHRPAAPLPSGPGESAGSAGGDQRSALGTDTGRGPDSGRALEPGRTTGGDPRPTAPANPSQPGHAPAKSRDTDLAALLFGPVSGEPGTSERRPGGVRAFLLTSPGARPVLAIIEPGREPIFVTGLTRCASALPACAAPLPAAASTDVY